MARKKTSGGIQSHAEDGMRLPADGKIENAHKVSPTWYRRKVESKQASKKGKKKAIHYFHNLGEKGYKIAFGPSTIQQTVLQ